MAGNCGAIAGENRFVWAWFDTAENGSRFAYESIAVSRPISTF